MLTIKQKKLLDYIKSYYQDKDLFPTFEEMKDNLSIKSKSGIYKLLSSLEDKGYIKKIPHKARALKLNDLKKNSNQIDNTNLPFLGRIAAGNPIEAITGSFEQISVPNYLINNREEHFTLEVNGDSMIGEGIFDGDIVIICKTNFAQTGDIVVALIDDHEATLKRLRKKGQSIALESANPLYETKILSAHRVKIQGKLVGLLRKY